MPWLPRYIAHWCRFKRHHIHKNDTLIRRGGAFANPQRSYARRNEDREAESHWSASNAEWTRLRDLMAQNAYDTLFGRSNDMLAGKGGRRLGDEDESGSSKRNKTESTTSRQPHNTNPYPRKVELNAEGTPRTRETVFPEPSYRSRIMQSNYSSAIISPSDTRRPRDVPPSPEMSKVADDVSAEHGINIIKHNGDKARDSRVSYQHTQSRSSVEDQGQARDQEPQKRPKEKPFRDSDSINVVHFDGQVATESEDKNWRQTVLDRRGYGADQPNRRQSPLASTEQASQTSSAAAQIPSNQADGRRIDLEDSFSEGLQHRPLTRSGISRGVKHGEWPEEDWDVVGYDQKKHSTSLFKTKTLHDVKEQNFSTPPHGDESPVSIAESTLAGLQSRPLTQAEIRRSEQSGAWLEEDWDVNGYDQKKHSTSVFETKTLRDVEKKDPSTLSSNGNLNEFMNAEIRRDMQFGDWPTEAAHEHDHSGSVRGLAAVEIRWGNMSGNWPSNSLHDTPRERSTSDILGQLPKDDIDLLTASDIRASIGAKTKAGEQKQEKNKPRDQLEKDFVKAQKDGELESLIESKIINDQHIRRTEKQLLNKQKQESTTAESTSENASSYGIEGLAKLIQLGGDTLAKAFWSDPVDSSQLKAAKDLEIHLNTIRSAVEAGRAAMNEATSELSADIPSWKPLLTRVNLLRNPLLISVRNKLKPNHSPNGTDRAFNKTRMRGAQFTDKHLESAMATLKEMGKKELPYRSRKQISYTSRVVEKELKLMQKLIFHHQEHLQKSSIDESPDIVYWNIGYALHNLQEAMLELQMFLRHAMYKFDIKEELEDPSSIAYSASTSTDASANQETKPPRSHNIAAGQRLKNEVEAQKSAMQGLSDDGYNHASSSAISISVEEKKPLMDSLFRPFGLQLENLSKDSPKGETLEQEIKREHERINQEDFSVKASAAERKASNFDNESASSTSAQPFDTWKEIPILEEDTGREQERIDQEIVSMKVSEDEGRGHIVHNASTSSTSDQPFNKCQEGPTLEEETKQEQEQVDEQIAYRNMVNPKDTSTTEHPPQCDLPLSSFAQSTAPPPVSQATYTTLAYDPVAEAMYITNSTDTPSSPTPSIPIPVHSALATLDLPFKFLPYLPPRFDIHTVKPNLLVIRELPSSSTSLDVDSAPTSEIKYTRIPSESELRDDDWKRMINPVDGTTRLSPTGFVGVDDFREDIRREMAESRRVKEQEGREEETAQSAETSSSGSDAKQDKKAKRRGGVAGVFKTAIVAGAVCYIVGVGGEVVARDGQGRVF